MNERHEGIAGYGPAILFLGYVLLQLGAGWAGMEQSLGSGWGIAAAVAAVFLRFTLPVVIGAFLCALNIWHWHWFFAIVFAAPGLLFMAPAIYSSLVGMSLAGVIKQRANMQPGQSAQLSRLES